MKGYKAFNPGLVCRGKQYAEYTVFEEDSAEICKRGMHFCENPLDVLDYYPLVNSDGDFSDFATVEACDKAETDDGKKFCTKKLEIGAKLSFSGFVNACVDFCTEKMKYSSECFSRNYSQIGTSGDDAQIASSGDDARIASSGEHAKIASSGDDAQIASSGDDARIASSGEYAIIGSSGDDARIASSESYALIGSSGNYAQIGSSGNYAKIGSFGNYAVVCCAGHNCRVKAKIGSWITLSEWGWKDEKYIPLCVKTEFVDGVRIKEDTFYVLKNGKFVEHKQ